MLNVLLPIWKTKHVTARRVAQRMKKIFDYAKSRGYWEGDNPADWDGHLQYVLPRNFNRRIKHHSAMAYQDIPNLFIQLQDHDCLSSTALQFTILTASRTKEVIMATRDEFDFKKRLWSLPAYRMKSNKDHVVPSQINVLNSSRICLKNIIKIIFFRATANQDIYQIML